MNRPIKGLAALTAAALATLAAHDARAHGFAGDRFFPATILTDDPFVADEMSLPTLTHNPDRQRRLAAKPISKSISPSA